MIKVAVSACLLGQNVRYDGKNKQANLEKYFDSDIFHLVPICPEVEMGLSIPRSPIQLINKDTLKLVQVDDHTIELTNQMQTWFQTNYQNISKFSGFILKSKSPSCGNQTTPIYTYKQTEIADGLFVKLLKQDNPSISLIDEIEIENPDLRNNFLNNLLHKDLNQS